MALFGFSDITFNKGSTSPRGPLASLVDSKYETNTLRYPSDLGNWDKAHYLVFYIRKQNKTSTDYQYGTGNDGDLDAKVSAGAASSVASGVPNLSSVASSFGSEVLGKLNSGLSAINSATGGSLSSVTDAISKGAGQAVGSISNLFGQSNSFLGGSGAATTETIDNSIKKITGGSLKFLRTTTLTTDAVALYMPDTLHYTYSQGFENADIGGELGGKLLAAGSSALDSFKKEGGLAGAKAAGGSLVKSGVMAGAEKVRDAAGGMVGQNTAKLGFTAVTGVVTNPMLELIYKTPNFRTFQFEFMFYPRSEQEAYEVQRIIERFRFHQAPELAGSGLGEAAGAGGAKGYLVPPSEFDIRFYYAGAQNPNIPQIATCVLTNIDTNYAPNGWSAYEVPGENKPALGRTGMPTAIQMTLQFQETTYLTKADFRNDLAIGARGPK